MLGMKIMLFQNVSVYNQYVFETIKYINRITEITYLKLQIPTIPVIKPS